MEALNCLFNSLIIWFHSFTWASRVKKEFKFNFEPHLNHLIVIIVFDRRRKKFVLKFIIFLVSNQ